MNNTIFISLINNAALLLSLGLIYDFFYRGTRASAPLSNRMAAGIIIGGYSPDIVRDKASLGSDVSIVFKPITPADLLRKVRSMLDKGGV